MTRHRRSHVNIVPFNYRDHEVRTLIIDGEPWFVLADLARVLGIADVQRLNSRLDDGVRQTHPIQDRLGRTQNATIVSEVGMYEVVIRSDKPEATAFRRWITAEVLPSIRKTGSYGVQHRLPATFAEALRELASTVEERDALKGKVESDAPAVEYVAQHVIAESDAMTFRDACKHLGIREKDLRAGLVDAGLIYKLPIERRWTPTGPEEYAEWRAYAAHASKFSLRAQHNAPRHHNGQVRQTLYILAAALPAIAKRLDAYLARAT